MQKLFYLGRWAFLRDELDRLLALSLAFSVSLVMAASVYTGRPVYFFLCWNLFLAYIPFLITQLARRFPAMEKRKSVFAFRFLIWLAFLPNTFYLLTDLFHLGEMVVVPAWFDLLVLLSFAFNGVFLGVLSMRQMEKETAQLWPVFGGPLFVYPLMWLNAWGVYIGRYLRFNSWDVVASPLTLAQDLLNLLIHPVQHRQAWAMVIGFSMFMTLVYQMLKRASSK